MTMKYTKNIFLLLSLFFVLNVGFSSCYSEQNMEVSVQNNKGELSQKRFLERPQYVFLDGENPEATISLINKVMFLKNRIIVLDRSNRNRLLLFDQKGKFLASADKFVGKGKNEYLQFSDCAIDKDKQLIYMYCDRPYQFMIFDSDLNLLKVIKTKEFISEIALDKKYLYAFCVEPEKNSSYELRRYDKKNLNGKYKVLLSFDKVIKGVGGMGHSLCDNGNQFYFSMPFSNEIHEIKDGEVKNSMTIEFGKEWFSYNESKNLHGRRFMNKNKERSCIIQNMVSSDSILFFNTDRSPFYKVNMNDMKGDSYKYFTDNYFPYSSSWFIPCCGLEKSVVQYISVRSMNAYLKLCKEKNRKPMPELQDCAVKDSVKNTILQIFKIK